MSQKARKYIPDILKDIKPWNIRDIKRPYKKDDHFRMILLGSSNSGKSYFLINLLKTHLVNCFDIFIVVSPMPDNLEAYKRVLPSNMFYTEYPKKQVEKLVRYNQEQILKKGGRPAKILIILDDCAGKMTRQNDVLNSLFTRGTHDFISTILTTQYYKLISPTIRENATYIVIFQINTNFDQMIKDLFRRYMDKRDIKRKFSSEELERIISLLTTDYHAIILNQNYQELFLQDKIKIYRA